MTHSCRSHGLFYVAVKSAPRDLTQTSGLNAGLNLHQGIAGCCRLYPITLSCQAKVGLCPLCSSCPTNPSFCPTFPLCGSNHRGTAPDHSPLSYCSYHRGAAPDHSPFLFCSCDRAGTTDGCRGFTCLGGSIGQPQGQRCWQTGRGCCPNDVRASDAESFVLCTRSTGSPLSLPRYMTSYATSYLTLHNYPLLLLFSKNMFYSQLATRIKATLVRL